MEFVHFLSIIVSDRIFNTKPPPESKCGCCQEQGGGQSCRYHLSRGKAAPQIGPQVTPAPEERAWGSLHPSGCWAQALEKMPRLGRVRGAAFCCPCSACTFQRCTERCRASDTSSPFQQRGWNSSAQKWEKQIHSRIVLLSDVCLPTGQLLPRKWKHRLGHCHLLDFSKRDSRECRDPVSTRRWARGGDAHTRPRQQQPSSPRHRHTVSPPTDRHKAQHSRGLLHTLTPSLCECPCASRCRNCLCCLSFAEFLSVLLCLPSHFPGRGYSRGENKLPHLLLCASCTLGFC